MRRILQILAAFLLGLIAASASATTWYIRVDGGTRYSANVTSGQCSGQADAAYPGSGVNQPCAFSDYRYLWDDQSYANDAWVIAGGDTVIIRGCASNGNQLYPDSPHCRIGFDSNTGSGAGYTWCIGGQGSFACINPTIPSGTAGQHTRILGANYASCSTGTVTDRSKLTQLYAGFGAWSVLNLTGTKFVDVECLELTSHAKCITHGSPAVPKGCSSSSPVDDYDSEGVVTDVGTSNVYLQDVYIHGNTDRGVKGALGGPFTCLRCDVAYNGMAGWDFDDGTTSSSGYGTPSLAAAVWNFNYSTIEWNGCNQIYPGTGADTCYGQSSGGYGDGVGTPPGMCITANIDHSAFNYNTQDGLDLGHGDTGSCPLTITNSIAIGNSGGTFKAGPNEAPFVFMNNIAEANCHRLEHPMAGASSYYNANLSDFCRSGDAMAFNFRPGGSAILANNTMISYAPTSYDMACWGDVPCTTSTLIFENNITIGYDNPATYNQGGQAGGVGGLYFQNTMGPVTRRSNIWYGMRSSSFNCPTGNPGEVCANPLLTNQPAQQGASFTDTELDNLNFKPTALSPAVGGGIVYAGIPATDFYGVSTTSPPVIGAANASGPPPPRSMIMNGTIIGSGTWQ